MTERDHRSGEHELHERLVERLALVLGVVGGQEVARGLPQLEADQDVALRLDAPDHLAGETTADAVGLDEDQGAFHGRTLSSGGGRSPPGDPASTSSGTGPSWSDSIAPGAVVERYDARPPPGGHVLVLVGRTTGPGLHRCLDQGYGDHDGRRELLARVAAQGRRPAGHHVVDEEVEGVVALDLVLDEARRTRSRRPSGSSSSG